MAKSLKKNEKAKSFTTNVFLDPAWNGMKRLLFFPLSLETLAKQIHGQHFLIEAVCVYVYVRYAYEQWLSRLDIMLIRSQPLNWGRFFSVRKQKMTIFREIFLKTIFFFFYSLSKFYFDPGFIWWNHCLTLPL